MLSLLRSLLVRELRLEHFPPTDTSQQRGVREFQNCMIMPDSVCLHELHGVPIPGTFLERGLVGSVDYPYGYPPPIDAQSAKQSTEKLSRVVFLPYSDLAHFGHLLTEGAGWFWPFFDDDFRNLLFDEHHFSPNQYPVIVLVDRPKGSITTEKISAWLGVPESCVRLTSELQQPIDCQNVTVPIPSMVNRRYILPHHFHAVQRLLDRVYEGAPAGWIQAIESAGNPNLVNRVYLSRAKLPNSYRLLHGEQELEDRLRDFGWDIVYPEQLSIAEQLSHLASARTIAGEAGSAFHLLMALGSQFAEKRVAMLGVRRVGRDPRVLNFIAQFRIQPVDFRYLGCLGFSPRKFGTNDGGNSIQMDRYLFTSPRRTAQWLNKIANEPSPLNSRVCAKALRS